MLSNKGLSSLTQAREKYDGHEGQVGLGWEMNESEVDYNATPMRRQDSRFDAHDADQYIYQN